ncbi:NAD(P)/FAD-dependent oxidoreductase [Cryobacterium arcticum]|uniref:Pyridine nucleotide-disulfide oxidoreductase n=1 Tax=Cryobacterium arcticum TaxID=670052 RepID=A0A317ZP05_9MICO|nr:FAD-dependent oxidoreductase [Cryobacterium arcticum]PXA65765.1 pyridine nucleotide-disulfide oxidoreductase [Cryobacterium arcticum]
MTETPAGAEHHRVIVIGGGNAGLSVAGRLRRYGVDDVVVVEPRDQHVYQPLLSHVAGGTARAGMAIRPQESVIPSGVEWIQDSVVGVLPDSRSVLLASGRRLGYDQLVVCPGIQKDWNRVPGLAAAMASPWGVSNYEFALAAKASKMLRSMRRGTVVFSQPAGPASCAGAAQKPMYLACDYWRSIGVLDQIRVVLVVPDPTVFGIPLIDAELNRKIAEYGIELRTDSTLLEVDADRRTVLIGRAAGNQRETVSYDILHAVPPQSAPDWLKSTPLPAPGDPSGFIDVDPETLRHSRFPDVWALGDAAATRNSKSGGALRPQAKVLAQNLVAALAGRPVDAAYDNYSVCPFTVSRSTVVFAEFDDHLRPKPTIPFWPGLARERRLSWIFDRHILPWVYWHLILNGRA